jgi:hypothetical protein
VVPLREPDLKNRRRIGGTNKQVLQSPKSPTRHKSNANKFHSIHGAPPMPDEFDAPMSPVPGITKTPPRSPSSPPNTPISIRESLRSPPPPVLMIPPVWFQPTPPITPLSPLSSSDHNALYRVSSNVSIASTGSSRQRVDHAIPTHPLPHARHRPPPNANAPSPPVAPSARKFNASKKPFCNCTDDPPRAPRNEHPSPPPMPNTENGNGPSEPMPLVASRHSYEEPAHDGCSCAAAMRDWRGCHDSSRTNGTDTSLSNTTTTPPPTAAAGQSVHYQCHVG